MVLGFVSKIGSIDNRERFIILNWLKKYKLPIINDIVKLVKKFSVVTCSNIYSLKNFSENGTYENNLFIWNKCWSKDYWMRWELTFNIKCHKNIKTFWKKNQKKSKKK